MTPSAREPSYASSSLRNPRARDFYRDGHAFRAIARDAENDFRAVRETGLLDDLVADGMLVPVAVVDAATTEPPSGIDTASTLLEHEKLPLITHPYVWSFSGLKERFSANATLALAVIHHLVIGSRIPMEETLPWLLDLLPHGRNRVRAADGSADQPHDRARCRRGRRRTF